jgi:hypothetical protein
MNTKTQIEIIESDFYTLDDKTIAWTCIEPAIQKIKGKNLTIKSQAYATLTSGQKSLLVFWILFGHTRNGIVQFYNELDYLLKKPGIWMELINSVKYFGDDNLNELMKEMEILYHDYIKIDNHKNADNGSNDFNNDSNFLLTVKLIDNKLNNIIQDSFKRIGKFIRENSNEFVHFK